MSYLIKDEDHVINTEVFSTSYLHSIFVNRGYDSKTGELLDFIDAKKYVLKFFYRVESGYIFNESGKIENKSDETVTKTYLRRFDDKIRKWFLGSPEITIYKPVCIPNRQLIVENTINVMSKFKHDNDMKYEDCNEKDKKGVAIMLNFIMDVWCSNNEEQYKYVLDWFANMIQGNKNQTLLYVKSTTEGIGKSTLTNFIMKHVIGSGVAVQSNSYPLLTGNNLTLLGKVFVIFEELSKSTKNEWEKMSSCLKEWITSDVIQYSEKYVAPFTSTNLNNYIINTNAESIKSADGRRYYICDLSTKYLNDHKYWTMLNNTCFNDEVGKAFYLYFVNRDVKNFNSAIFPMTSRKKEYMVDLIKSPLKFIKFNYLLSNKNINCTTKELYEFYLSFCEKTETKEFSKRAVISLLTEVGIKYKSSASKQTYNVEVKELKRIADQHKWLYDDDAEEMRDNIIWKGYKTIEELTPPNNKAYDNLFITKDYIDEIEKLKQQLLLLQTKNDELQKEVDFLKRPKEPEPEPAKVIKPKPAKVIKPKPAKVIKPKPTKVIKPKPVKVIKTTPKKTIDPVCEMFLNLSDDE